MLGLALLNHRRRKGSRRVSWVSVAVSVFTVLFFSSAFRMAERIVRSVTDYDYSLSEVWIGDFVDTRKSSGRILTADDAGGLMNLGGVTGVKVEKRGSLIMASFGFEGMELSAPVLPLVGVRPELDTFSRARVDASLARDPSFRPILSGRDLMAGDEDSCLAYYETASQLGLTYDELVGRIFTITTPDGRVIELKVVGVYDKMLGPSAWITDDDDGIKWVGPDGKLASGFEYCIVTWDVISKMDGAADDGSFSLTLSADDPESALELYGELNSRLRNLVTCEYERINSTVENLHMFSSLFLFIGGVLSLLSALNLYTAAMAQVSARRQWFALMDILGFRRGRTAGSYSLEVLIGMIKGYLAAVSASTLLSALLGYALTEVRDGFVFTPAMALPPAGDMAAMTVAGALVYSLTVLSVFFRIRGIDTVSALL